jgi:hypothetical protein
VSGRYSVQYMRASSSMYVHVYTRIPCITQSKKIRERVVAGSSKNKVAAPDRASQFSAPVPANACELQVARYREIYVHGQTGVLLLLYDPAVSKAGK